MEKLGCRIVISEPDEDRFEACGLLVRRATAETDRPAFVAGNAGLSGANLSLVLQSTSGATQFT
jgi:hypothetical protein